MSICKMKALLLFIILRVLISGQLSCKLARDLKTQIKRYTYGNAIKIIDEQEYELKLGDYLWLREIGDR